MSRAGLAARLAELRRAGPARLAPLWIDTLAPGEALHELEGRAEAVACLQRARVLWQLGRSAEAAAVLDGLEALPPGLAPVRAALQEVLDAASHAPERADTPAQALEAWLVNIRRWRRALGV